MTAERDYLKCLRDRTIVGSHYETNTIVFYLSGEETIRIRWDDHYERLIVERTITDWQEL